jgi:hypothetical protein
MDVGAAKAPTIAHPDTATRFHFVQHRQRRTLSAKRLSPDCPVMSPEITARLATSAFGEHTDDDARRR